MISNNEVGEQDGESDYDYFGARYYNSKLGMWLQVDPLAEKYAGWSPFNYVMNNPLIFFDPDGMEGDSSRTNSSVPSIDPIKLFEQIVGKAGNSLINSTLDGLDNMSQTISDGSTVGIVALGLAGFVFEPAWAAIPYVAGAGTAADLVTTATKGGKILTGTGTTEDFYIKAVETGFNYGFGKTANAISSKFARTSTFVREGRIVTQFRNSRHFVSNQYGKTVTMLKDVVTAPISLGVSVSINKLKNK